MSEALLPILGALHAMAFTAHVLNISLHLLLKGYGATAARLTPDQKVGSSNLSGLTYSPFCSLYVHTH